MRLDKLSPDMPGLLKEMGIKYDPDRLSAVLSKRWPQVCVLCGGGGMG